MSDRGHLPWRWRTAAVPGTAVIKAELSIEGGSLSFAEVLMGWRQDDVFRRDWSRWLADIPMASYCWELPVLTKERLSRPFECVFVESPALAIPLADPSPFAEFLAASSADQDAVIFPNLGGDALLVAPTLQAPASVYSHLARFLREAPERQAASFWQAVAEAVDRRLGEDPSWLSTAGLGVAWLHVRIDSSPKYYRHRPYTRRA